MTCKNLKQYSDQMFCSVCERGCDIGDETDPSFTKTLRCLANPFYRQPLFKKEDILRAQFNPVSIWARLNLMFLPTWCQISDGYVIYYKQRTDGRVYIMGYEPLPSANIDKLIDFVPVQSDDGDEKTRRTLY